MTQNHLVCGSINLSINSKNYPFTTLKISELALMTASETLMTESELSLLQISSLINRSYSRNHILLSILICSFYLCLVPKKKKERREERKRREIESFSHLVLRRKGEERTFLFLFKNEKKEGRKREERHAIPSTPLKKQHFFGLS